MAQAERVDRHELPGQPCRPTKEKSSRCACLALQYGFCFLRKLKGDAGCCRYDSASCILHLCDWIEGSGKPALLKYMGQWGDTANESAYHVN